jgi:voltage-gated potassium channel
VLPAPRAEPRLKRPTETTHEPSPRSAYADPIHLIPLLSVPNRRATIRLRGGVGIYVARGASLLAFCAALAVLDAKRSSPDANISDFGDAIWWAVNTMTTFGYGDHYPVTAAGRLVAFGLMIGGIALLGTVTATLASWLVETVAAEKEQAEYLQVMVRRLEDKIDQLAGENVPERQESR